MLTVEISDVIILCQLRVRKNAEIKLSGWYIDYIKAEEIVGTYNMRGDMRNTRQVLEL